MAEYYNITKQASSARSEKLAFLLWAINSRGCYAEWAKRQRDLGGSFDVLRQNVGVICCATALGSLLTICALWGENKMPTGKLCCRIIPVVMSLLRLEAASSPQKVNGHGKNKEVNTRLSLLVKWFHMIKYKMISCWRTKAQLLATAQNKNN